MTSSNWRQLVVVGVLAAAVLYLGPLRAAFGQTDGINEEKAVAEEETDGFQKRIDAAKKVKRNAAKAQADLEEIKAAFPPGPDQAGLLEMISNAARESGVTWSASSSADPSQKSNTGSSSSGGASRNTKSSSSSLPGVTVITQSIDVKGDAGYLKDFVAALRSADRAVAIDEISISNSGGAGTPTARMTVRAFSWPGGAAK